MTGIFQFEQAAYRYAFAVIIAGLCMILTLLIRHFIDLSTFQLSVAAVVLSAWYGGLWPGLLASALLSLGNAFFLLEPRYSFAINGVDDLLRLGVFILVSVLMSVLSEASLKAQRALSLRTAELEAANKELEAFSYSVSHDLRSPLRMIDNYARVGLETSPPVAPVHHALESIRGTVGRMGQLVDDLLSFSRLGRQPLQKRYTDPAELVQDALDELRAEQDGRSIDISILRLPKCQADPALLKIVFVNLLHNALKFTRRRSRACIEIGCRSGDDGPVYYVKDNGIGFDMQFTQQMFGLFQRLHRHEDIEGTGVGLAVVQRIIHRHGGRIWAEAEIDNGATFYFTLTESRQHD
jgi:light-regulated signal transduction histidine kinase (bacteriophytochrome)